MRHLKNSKPRMISVSEGRRVESTNISHHSSSNSNPFPLMRRNRLEEWVRGLKATHKIDLESTTHQPGKGFQVIPWRWAVERTFSWLHSITVGIVGTMND